MKIRALVLAAGHGMRLRPLTDSMPKPLLPILGRPILEHTLGSLAGVGCEAVALNLHHLGDQIEERLGGAYKGVRLAYSPEPQLLGTLGALGPLLDFVSKADLFLVINGDSLCRWPLGKLIKRHLRSDALASLLLSARANAKEFGGGVIVDREHHIRSFRGGEPGEKERRRVFAGAHVFKPKLLLRATRNLGSGAADFVSDLYEPLLQEGGLIQGVETRQHWHDLGTPQRYVDGARNWGLGRWPRRFWRQNWTAPGVELPVSAKVNKSVIERGASIGAGAKIDRSLILTGAQVGAGSQVTRAVIGPDVELPEGSSIKRRLVTLARAGVSPRSVDSVVGGLVYSRLEGSR